MYRVWGKKIKHNKIVADYVSINDNPNQDEAKKLILAVEDICQKFDLSQPYWLEDHQLDILKYGRTHFKEEHFIETIDFDELEIEIIEVDQPKS